MNNLGIFSDAHKPNITIGNPAELEARLVAEERRQALDAKLKGTQQQVLPTVSTPLVFANSSNYDVDAILNGRTFFSDKTDASGNHIGVSIALEQALTYAGTQGIVTNLSEFITAKVKAEKSHDFWQKWYTVHTEENIGVDKKGLFYKKNEPVLVIVNGGGILTPSLIGQAIPNGLVEHSAKYKSQEFNDLLEGKLPSGIKIPLYKFEDVKKGISNLPHQFGVVMPYDVAQATTSGYHQKKQFLENPLVIARAAGCLNQLEAFYEKAKASDGDLGNYHPFTGRDATQPQGRLLFVYDNYGGRGGNSNLDYDGRFVGVAPEAHNARKK